MAFKKTYITVEVALELQNYISDVWCERCGERGGILHYTLEKGEQFYSVYRLYSDCKADFMKFPFKVRLSQKAAREKYKNHIWIRN
jgi:hypothetical protein